MSRTWRVIVSIFLIFMIGIAVVSSVDNGSPLGNYLNKSGIIRSIEYKYKNLMEDAFNNSYQGVHKKKN